MKRFLPAVVVAIVLTQSAVQADNAFYRVVAAKPNATFEDAVRAFLELAVDTDAAKIPYEKQFDVLTDMKVVRRGWVGEAQEKLTRGRVAYMICRTCGIKGGLSMAVLGTTERYAFRECVFLGIWEGGTQRDYMTGGELVGVLKWAADYLDLHPEKKVRPSSSAEGLPKGAAGGPAPFGPAPADVNQKPATTTPPAKGEEKKDQP